jgi:hypothetical protein
LFNYFVKIIYRTHLDILSVDRPTPDKGRHASYLICR